MKDIAVPPLVPVTAEGNLSDLPARNGLERPGHAAFARREGTRWVDVTNAQFLAEVRALAKGLVAAGVARGRPRRPHEQDPLRVDAGRLRHLDRRGGHGADLRDLVGRAGQLDPERLRLRSPSSSRHPRTRGRWPRCATACPGCATSGRSTPAAWTSWPPPGPTPPTPSSTSAGARGPARRHRDDHLHLGHDRPAEGLRADPRQLHGARREHRRAPRRRRQREGRLDPAVPAAGARLRAVHRGAVRPVRRPHRPHRRHQEPAGRPRHVPARRSSSRCRGSSRRSTTPPSRRPTPRARARSSRRPPAPPSTGAAPGTTGGPARCCALKHALFDKLVYTKLRAALGGKVQYAVSGGAPLGRPARPLLPRHRPHRARGLRPDRDHGTGHGQHARRRSRSARSARRCRASRSGSPTTARC